MSPSFFTNLYKQWIWIGVPVIVGAVVALGLLIHGVIRVVRNAHLFKVPLAETQDVQFAAAGRVVLSIEGPRFTRRFAHVAFEMRGVTGERMQSRPTLFHAQTSGMSTARMELMTFDIPRPGRYVLRMTSLGPPRENDRDHAVVFMRPHLWPAMAYVLGIVLAGMVFIASLVFFLMRVFEVGMDPGAAMLH